MSINLYLLLGVDEGSEGERLGGLGFHIRKSKTKQKRKEKARGRKESQRESERKSLYNSEKQNSLFII